MARTQLETGKLKLKLAQRLDASLRDENVRWVSSMRAFAESQKTVLGDVLLASAFVSLAGPFSKTYRDEVSQAAQARLSMSVEHAGCSSFGDPCCASIHPFIHSSLTHAPIHVHPCVRSFGAWLSFLSIGVLAHRSLTSTYACVRAPVCSCVFAAFSRSVFHQLMKKHCVPFLRKHQVPLADVPDPLDVLATPVEQLTWISETLPDDQVSERVSQWVSESVSE